MTRLEGKGADYALNNLARLKTQEMLLRDISVDLMVCKIEGWDYKKYSSDLKKLIDNVYGAINEPTQNTYP